MTFRLLSICIKYLSAQALLLINFANSPNQVQAKKCWALTSGLILFVNLLVFLKYIFFETIISKENSAEDINPSIKVSDNTVTLLESFLNTGHFNASVLDIQ